MATVKNVSGSARSWPNLKNEENGQTLFLGVDEEAEVNLPEGFKHPNFEIDGVAYDDSEPEPAPAEPSAPPVRVTPPVVAVPEPAPDTEEN